MLTEALERWATTRRGRVAAAVLAATLILWQGSRMHVAVVKAGREHGNDYEGLIIGARALLEGQTPLSARA